MTAVNVTKVEVLDNPARFTSPFKFDISFECLIPLKEDLEWKLVYVGSADTTQYDQEIESILVGPVPVGLNRFTFQAPPPDPTKIPPSDLVGVTVILLQGHYRNTEFVRIGFYVNNEIEGLKPEDELPPVGTVDVKQVVRNILSGKPRVTRFNIEWDPVTLS
eukprot:TRINITY_DN3130_c0_g1_i1.p1 TRINITY_DN3130_c0_g1~~TRINITY_DN3130_c0_g1_i1.p1  ORF type:complete len:162 (+),score=17.86 TRINITY_DN3130_c0_g1_i1:53-538(+)